VLQHGTNLHEEQVRVPLLIRSPYLAANVRLAGPVQLEDLFPTILSFAGVTPPERIDGVDLRAWLEGRAPEPPREYVLGRRKRYPRRPDVYFALGADAKWIGERAKPGSSYALDTDSRELSAATGQGMPIPLERQIEHAERTRGRGAPSRVVDPEVQRALEQLGYVDEAREPDP
jgi:hypothetical protein